MSKAKLVKIQSGIVMEMNSKFADGTIDVPLASGVNLEQLIAGDDKPMFVTIDALSDTISENKRRWTTLELHRIAEQVMSKIPDGYQGHIPLKDRASKAPDAVTLWLGAVVAEHKGRQRLFVKGYVLPKAHKFRDYLGRASSAGKNLAVSVYGQAMETWNKSLEAFEISNFNLESIDWARPGAEGVPNSGYLKLTTEMDEGDRDMTKEEALKSATVAEMREFAPAVVQEIEQTAQADLQTVVSEMVTVTGVSDSKELKQTVQEMQERNSELEHKVAEGEVDRLLGGRITNIAARKTLKKMVIGEMADKDVSDLKVVEEMVNTVLATEEGSAIRDAFKAPIVPPTGQDNRDQPSGRRFTKLKGKKES